MHELTACRIAAGVRSGRMRAAQVMRECLDRTERLEPVLNTYAWLDQEGAMAQAEAVDARIRAGVNPGPLAGVPVSVKDLIAVRGQPQAFGSRVFRDHVAADDAPAVARLREAGACITGKTTTSELGSKAVGDSPLTGITRNPWNTGRTPGGSSAGAAAGVAAGLVPVALGTDGGGSIRIPASFCGLAGLKGSHGRVPVWPPSATPGLAHVGPLARDAADLALVFEVIAGPDARDPTSLAWPDWHGVADTAPMPPLRLDWCEDFAWGWATQEVRQSARDAAERLARALQVPLLQWDGLAEDPAPAWTSEFYAGIAARLGLLEAHDAAREALLDPLLARQVAQVRAMPTAARSAAGAMAGRCREQLRRAFQRFDLLLTPTTPVAALPVGQDRQAGWPGHGAVEWSYFTYPFNLGGQPAASWPGAATADGLPTGLQVAAAHGREDVILAALRVLQACCPPAPLPC
jgi:aspartyl-tRNA(Asn)/glutamyl-tRNA(Gln) amidotransferase subunit A